MCGAGRANWRLWLLGSLVTRLPGVMLSFSWSTCFLPFSYPSHPCFYSSTFSFVPLWLSFLCKSFCSHFPLPFPGRLRSPGLMTVFSLSPQSALFSQLVQRFSLSIQSAEYTFHQACWPFPQRCYLGIQVPGCGPREKSVDLGLNAGSSSGKSLASSKVPQHWDIPSQGCTVFWFVFLVLSTLSQAPLCVGPSS